MKPMVDAEQFTLAVSVRATRCEVSTFDTLDCRRICRCDDGSDYAVKDGASVRSVPHSEWFCTHLGEAVGLASPPCKIVDVNGEACFGSRWETGHDASDWWLRARAGAIDFASLAPTLSRIYAFDLFVNNLDRHFGNFIVREQHFGTSLLAFDYSRAWLVNGVPPSVLPMPGRSATTMTIRALRRMFGDFYSVDEANHVLDRLQSLKLDQIANIIESHPKEWLTKKQSSTIIAWWKSAAKPARIDDIRKGVKDGDYL